MHGRDRKGCERGAGNSRCDEFSLSHDLMWLAVRCFSSWPGLPDGSMSPLPTFGPEWFRIPPSNPLSRHHVALAYLASTGSDHSSASASCTLRAGPNGPDGPNGLVPTDILGTIGTLATLTDDGATCGDSFTRQTAPSDICFGCSSCTSSLWHARHTNCTVCRLGLGKPNMG